MKPSEIFRLGLRAALVGLTLAATAVAAAPDDKKIARAQQERIARMQQAQQALEQEKSQLSADNADMERKLRTARTDLDHARAQARKEAARQVELDGMQKEKDALAGQLAALNNDLSAARQKLLTTEQTVSQLKLSVLAGQRDAELQKTSLQACDKQNLALYQLNTDLLARYESAASQGKGLVSKLLNPFAQVRLENDTTAYRDQLDSHKRDAVAVQSP
jgi:predicted  nucleic acid-binding Zn-ribbon protein